METTEYWPMAHEYGIQNTTITSLQFWTEDLDPITLGIASECVYTTFFWTPTSHTLWQLPEDVLFGCFVIALNAAFTQQLSLADEGYESGPNTADLPTPLQKNAMHTPCFQHGTCIFQSGTHYTLPPSYHTEPWFITNPSKTSGTAAYHLLLTVQRMTRIKTAHQNTQMKKKISKQYLWMMNIGWQIWYWKEHFVYMKMGYPTMYVNTHALMGIVTLPHIWTA